MKKIKKELFAVSFLATDPKGLKILRQQWKQRDAEHKKFLGRSKSTTIKTEDTQLGGAVCLIDATRLDKGFISEIPLPWATGLEYDTERGGLFCASGKTIKFITNGIVQEQYTNKMFNDLHGLSKSKNGNLFVVSTGTDSILEFNNSNFSNFVWDWLATENGFALNPQGNRRVIDKNCDYTKVVTATPEHVTHINSCLEIGDNKILATLFHQGSVIEIDKNTKKWNTKLSGLKCPHNIRYSNLGYIVSDTLNNRVLVLTEKFKIIKEIKNNFNWVQDAIEIAGSKYLIADSNNSRLVLVNGNGKILNLLDYSKNDRKVFCFYPLSEEEAVKVFNI